MIVFTLQGGIKLKPLTLVLDRPTIHPPNLKKIQEYQEKKKLAEINNIYEKEQFPIRRVDTFEIHNFKEI